MKSSPSLITSSADGQHKAWSPEAFSADEVTAVQQEQKDHILSIFNSSSEAGVPSVDLGAEKKEKSFQSLLYTVENGRDFTSWMPTEFDWQPPFVDREDWAFIDPAVSLADHDGILPVPGWGSPSTSTQPGSADGIAHRSMFPQPGGEGKNSSERQKDSNPFDQEKVISSIVNRAHIEADQIIQEARKAAENLIIEAQLTADTAILDAGEEIERLKQEAFQKGLEDARDDYQSSIQAVQTLVQEVSEWQKALTMQSEKILVDMAKEIAQSMFGEGVKLDATALQVNLNRIMESAQGLGDLNIFLNPRDARLLDPSWSEYQLLITGDKVKIIPSENIKPGGCFVKGSMGAVDARVETQLSAILNSLDENQHISGEEND